MKHVVSMSVRKASTSKSRNVNANRTGKFRNLNDIRYKSNPIRIQCSQLAPVIGTSKNATSGLFNSKIYDETPRVSSSIKAPRKPHQVSVNRSSRLGLSSDTFPTSSSDLITDCALIRSAMIASLSRSRLQRDQELLRRTNSLFSVLRDRYQYTFQHASLLSIALLDHSISTHNPLINGPPIRSEQFDGRKKLDSSHFVTQMPLQQVSNASLSFIGDAVLRLSTATHLITRSPMPSKTLELTRTANVLNSNAFLSRVGREAWGLSNTVLRPSLSSGEPPTREISFEKFPGTRTHLTLDMNAYLNRRLIPRDALIEKALLNGTGGAGVLAGEEPHLEDGSKNMRRFQSSGYRENTSGKEPRLMSFNGVDADGNLVDRMGAGREKLGCDSLATPTLKPIATIVESVIGAVYLDAGGFDSAYKFVKTAVFGDEMMRWLIPMAESQAENEFGAIRLLFGKAIEMGIDPPIFRLVNLERDRAGIPQIRYEIVFNGQYFMGPICVEERQAKIQAAHAFLRTL